MKSKILILEKNEHYAERLQKMLIGMLDYQVIHVTSELAVVRELTANYVDLIVVGIHQARAKEGLRLIEILLVEKKVVTVAPIMVVSDVQDPAYIQQCVQAGISDYMLYPEDPVEILPRLKNVLNKSGGISEMLVRVSTTFLGPAARVFIEQQAKKKLNISSLKDLKRDQLPDFLRHLAVTIRPILKEKVAVFVRRLEQAFGLKSERESD